MLMKFRRPNHEDHAAFRACWPFKSRCLGRACATHHDTTTWESQSALVKKSTQVMLWSCVAFPSLWGLIILSTHVSGHIYSTKVWRSNRINYFSFQLISEFGNTWWSARNHSQFHHYLKHLFTLILYPCIYILYCLSEKSYIHLYPIL